jgi:AAA family ATP:ADP antiporter
VLQSFLLFLGAEAGEEKQMWLLLGKGTFMGFFIASYQVGAETLFLNTVGADYLDVAFFLAGAAGVVSTALYVQVQKKANFSSLVLTNSFIIFLFIAGLRYAFYATDYDSSSVDFHYLPFILFIMMGPIISITLLGFWGVFGRVFNLKQSKRIIGGIDTGQLIATMVAFFSIPVLTRTIIDDTYDLLFVSTISAFGVFVFTVLLVKNFNLNTATKVRKTDKPVKEIGYLDLVKNNYLRLLGTFMIFSVGSAVFAEYVYFSATEIFYPEENELRDFLSIINGLVMGLSFIIQSFINDIIIGKYGLKVSLMVMPFILAVFTLGAIISGHIYVYDVKSDEMLFFFIFIVAGKIFTSALKDALEGPAFKLFFLPFDLKIRFDIQSRIEGVLNEFAVLIAGGLQIAMGLLVFIKLIHYAYFILLLAFFIVYFAGKLFEEYKSELKSTLEDQKSNLKGTGAHNEHNTVNVLKEELRKKDPKRNLIALKLMERMEPILLDFSLLDFIRSEHKFLRIYAFRRLAELRSFNTLEILEREVKKEEDEDVNKMATYSMKILREMRDFKLTELGVKKLVRSTEIKDRVYAARVLAKMDDDKYVPFLVELMRDINPNVRKAAMVSAGKLKRPEFWSILIENLHIPTYSNTADSALIASGENVFGSIDSAFYKTGQELETQLKIIQILGKIGGKSAAELLWKKIDFPEKSIVSELLMSLSYIGFEAKDFQAARIRLGVDSDVGDVAWNMKALLEVPNEDYIDKMLVSAFREENKKNFDNIFMLLSMSYDAQSIKLVRENIEMGTTDSVSFGLEMLSIFMDENMKPKIVAVLDDTEDEVKLNHLGEFYPPENFESYHDLLLQIINRDYNHVNKWTKAVALYKLTLLPDIEITDDIIANLFNPDPVMVQTAGAVIYKLDKDAYHKHTQRLKYSVKKDLDKAIVPPVFKSDEEAFHQKLLLIERAILLKQIDSFSAIPGEILIQIASAFDEIKVGADVAVIEKGDSGNSPVYIVLNGELKVHDEAELISKVGEKEIIGHKHIIGIDLNKYSVTSTKETILLMISKEELYDKVSRHIEMVDGILTIVNEEKREEKLESIF